MNSGASSAFASVAYRLATDPDFAADLRQAGGIERFVDEFPALTVAEREALNTVVRQQPTFQRADWNAASSPVDGDWWIP